MDEWETTIPDRDFYEGLKEIVATLEESHNTFDTHAMSDYKLFKQGRKDMLKEVIDYLKTIRGDD